MTELSRRTFTRLAALSTAAIAARPLLAATPQPAGLVRLDSNENPYGPSPAALAAIRNELSMSNRYPDDYEELLLSDLARLHGVEQRQILLGNGSGELLKQAALAFAAPQRPIIAAKPTFESILRHARISGAEVQEVPLTPEFRHDLEHMIPTAPAGLIYVCNPNNPTASITPKVQLRAFLRAVPEQTAVIVDEAYHHYVESDRYESAIGLVKSHPNLVVLRTFSKIYGMAGLRCGYAVGQGEIVQKLRRQQPGNNMNLVALVAARASLADEAHVMQNRRRNTATRQDLTGKLETMGFTTIPSEANFVMIDVGREVPAVIRSLRENGVSVGRLFPALPTHLRVTVGTPTEMNRFLEVLPAVLA